MVMSRSDTFKFAGFLGVMLGAALCPQAARATLGEPESSVQSDAAQTQGSMKAMNDRESYRVHEIQMPSGTLLREFVSAEGKVFAVAWTGPTVPNLRQALGQYFERFVAGAKTNRTVNHSDRNHLQIQDADFVMQAGGHMRATFAGRAYLPTAIPSGFDLGDLH
jgi:hypothetical protein